MNFRISLCFIIALSGIAQGASADTSGAQSASSATDADQVKPRFTWFSGHEAESTLGEDPILPRGYRLFADLDPATQSKSLSDSLNRYSFGAAAQQPLATDAFVFGDISGFRAPGVTDNTDRGLLNFVAGGGWQLGQDRLSLPLAHQELLADRQRLRTFDALGLEWRHTLDSANLLTLSAQRGGYTDWERPTAGTASTQALVAWTSELGGKARPQITGSFFLGDEAAREETYRYLGRHYYGLAFEGSLNLFPNHTPYTSVQLRHSDYNANDPVFLMARREDYARLAAGWNWQINPNWGVRAEANYSLNNSTIDSYQYDQRQLFFTTRFDFR